ncbi:hypothetical protein [Tsukamurella ocularis]|uniref:hypothetical protein n=1 Tax=Tsukamurella ocularis TaxID=1970234 RepID=UPI002169E713|nr:hypothetical protein [Tsukamurella ocularis]MCS3781303.1 hypothetical protein [Tsukamurella ocularis]MCS3787674.1 hypothetical protein [Tsukamurella ocularis]MCS3850969.1 hypothetical protein [Tsukamurella ocularis]
MRRSDPTRSLGILAAVAASGLLLAGCGGSGDEAASSSAVPDVDVPSKALVQADLPAGLALSKVPSDDAFQGAMNSVGQVQAAQITPAACKDKNVAAQQEVLETIKYGVQQTLSKDTSLSFGVTLLPGSARLSVFEAAGTGECAVIEYGGGALKQATTRKDLPAGAAGAQGFVFEFARTANEKTARSASAYFSKNGVFAMVNANPSANGTYDTATFDDLVRRVAGRL